MNHKIVLWGALVLLSLGASPAWAQNGVVRDGIGAIAAGRGGTDVAHADTGSILLDNPAGMVNVEGNGLFEISADGIFTTVHYTDPLNSTFNKFRPEALPALSYIKKSEDGLWAFGLGLYAPAGFGAQYDLNSRVFGPQQLESFGALAKIVPGVAYHVTDRLSVGGTFGVGVSMVDFEGPLHFQTGFLSGAPALLHIHGNTAAPVWSAGLQYQLTDQTVVGLAYTEETRVHLHGTLDASVAGFGPGPVYSKFDSVMALTWPRSLVLGVTHTLAERHRLSADVGWIDWSSAFRSVDLKLTSPTNPLVTALLGPTVRDSIPLNWRDGLSVRLGYEFLLTPCDVLRAGYAYDSPAAVTATQTPYIPAFLENTFSLGYGKKWEQWNVDLAYQYSFGPKHSVAESALVGGDFSNSTLRAQVHFLMVSCTYRF